MKKVRNLLVMVMCVLLLSTLPVRNVSATEAEEYSDVTLMVML